MTDNFGEAGSIFTVSPVQITNFSSDFEFTILPFEIGIPLADGMTFCIQSAGPMALGGNGGGLGYELIPTSVSPSNSTFSTTTVREPTRQVSLPTENFLQFRRAMVMS